MAVSKGPTEDPKPEDEGPATVALPGMKGRRTPIKFFGPLKALDKIEDPEARAFVFVTMQVRICMAWGM